MSKQIDIIYVRTLMNDQYQDGFASGKLDMLRQIRNVIRDLCGEAKEDNADFDVQALLLYIADEFSTLADDISVTRLQLRNTEHEILFGEEDNDAGV